MVKSIGGWPGFSMTVRPITVAGASASEMSSITASKVVPGGSAIRSRIIAVPVSVSADAVEMNARAARIRPANPDKCWRAICRPTRFHAFMILPPLDLSACALSATPARGFRERGDPFRVIQTAPPTGPYMLDGQFSGSAGKNMSRKMTAVAPVALVTLAGCLDDGEFGGSGGSGGSSAAGERLARQVCTEAVRDEGLRVVDIHKTNSVDHPFPRATFQERKQYEYRKKTGPAGLCHHLCRPRAGAGRHPRRSFGYRCRHPDEQCGRRHGRRECAVVRDLGRRRYPAPASRRAAKGALHEL